MLARPEFAAAWLRQRGTGNVALAALEERELANLDDDEALRLTDALLAAVPLDALGEDRRTTSGLVIQQREFHRLRSR